MKQQCAVAAGEKPAQHGLLLLGGTRRGAHGSGYSLMKLPKPHLRKIA